jgi:hypothetical protein
MICELYQRFLKLSKQVSLRTTVEFAAGFAGKFAHRPAVSQKVNFPTP